MDLNPYESPAGPSRAYEEPDYGPWRDGPRLVCRVDTNVVVLPPWCVATGVGPIETPSIHQTVDVTDSFRLTLGPEIVTLVYRLEPERRRIALQVRSLGWNTLFGLGAICVVLGAAAVSDAYFHFPGILAAGIAGVAALLAYVGWWARAYAVKLARRSGNFVWFDGVSEGVLSRLRDWRSGE